MRLVGDLFNNCPPFCKRGGGLFLNRIQASDLLTNRRRIISIRVCSYCAKLDRIKCAMLGQLAELEYKAKRISDWRVGGRASRASRLRRVNRPEISGLHPTVRERHGREQRSSIVLKPFFGYLNCRPTNIVVKYSTEGEAILY